MSPKMVRDMKIQVMDDHGNWVDFNQTVEVLALRRIERALERIHAYLDHVVRRVDAITFMEGKQMKTLAEVIDIITPLKSQVAGLNTLMDAMRQKIADLLAGEIVPPALQAKIDAVFAEAKGLSDEITVAIVENTPVVEPPPVDPPVDPPPVDPPPVDPPVDGEV